MTSHLLAAALVAALVRAGAAADRAASVDEIFKEFTVPGSPGCTVAVYQDGKTVLSRAYGMANLDHDVRLTPSSIFHVASVSKQFTAAAILLLAQDGKLTLDDDIRKHVPELPDFGKRSRPPSDPSHQRPPRPVVAARICRLALLARSHHRR